MLLHHSRLTKVVEVVDITEDIKIIEAKEDVALDVEEIREVAMVARVTVIYQITVGHIEFLPTQSLTVGPL